MKFGDVSHLFTFSWTQFFCSSILQVVWHATASMLLPVKLILLNYNTQLRVVTSEVDQFFTTIFMFGSSL